MDKLQDEGKNETIQIDINSAIGRLFISRINVDSEV
jgi:hypothetical protein